MCAGGFRVRLDWFNRMHRFESEKKVIGTYWRARQKASSLATRGIFADDERGRFASGLS